jgi:hypothetical protein
MRSIDFIIDRSILRLPENQIFQDLLNSLCNSNHKLDFVDRNGRRPALFVWLELILDGLPALFVWLELILDGLL